jgi:L-aminopeptidase/D-esterase-like protein
MKITDSITDIPGILVGHAQDNTALTGCTVVICERGATGGVDQRGGAPGTRETDALRPMHLVEKAHAVMLAGGSAFGLDAATGAMRYLEEKGIGYRTMAGNVPIVASAILYDLALGSARVRPDAEMGYRACAAATRQPPAEGNAGAGCGCSVGKIFGMSGAMKSGIGTASLDCGGGIMVGALIAVNAFGDVVNDTDGAILAGARSIRKGIVRLGKNVPLANTMVVMRTLPGRLILKAAGGGNTVIGVVATNARLSKDGANKMAQMAQDGIARTIRPAHSMLDGDTIFTLATGSRAADATLVGAFAAEAVSRAIVKAVRAARSAGGLPAADDLLLPHNESV